MILRKARGLDALGQTFCCNMVLALASLMACVDVTTVIPPEAGIQSAQDAHRDYDR